MPRSFGPWATAASAGSKAHLSTFWKRRLAMLPAVHRSSARLGRRAVLFLILAAGLIWALPVLRGADPSAPRGGSGSAAAAGIQDAELGRVLDGWARGCRALQSYDIWVTTERRFFLALSGDSWKPRKQPLVSSVTSHQVYSNGKRRIECETDGRSEGMNHPSKTMIAWDGEAAKTIIETVSGPHTATVAIDSRMSCPSPEIGDYESLYRRIDPAAEDLAEMMSDRPGTKVEKRDGSQVVLYTPAGIGPFNYSPVGFRVWLDSTKNFMPTRIQHLYPVSGTEILLFQIDNTLQQVQPGVWAPIRSTLTNFPTIVPADGRSTKSGDGTVTVDLRRSTFNRPAPESAFKLDTPAGAQVLGPTADAPGERTLVRQGDPVPAFQITMVDGRTFRSRELKGKIVMIYFFSSISRRGFSFLEEVSRRFQSQALVVLAIGIGWKNSDLVASQKSFGLTIPIGGDPNREIHGKFVSKSTPSRGVPDRLYVVGPDGRIAAQAVATPDLLAHLADKVQAGLGLRSRARERIVSDPTTPLGTKVEPRRKSGETLEQLYALRDGEVLKRVPPPFSPSRLVYYRQRQPTHTKDIPEGPSAMYFRFQDGRLNNWWGGSFGGPALPTVIRMLTDIYPQEIEGDVNLIRTEIEGDWIVRVGTPVEKIIARMDEILRNDCKLPIKLTLREVDRDVIVAKGDYRFTPLPRRRGIEIYGEALVTQRTGGGGGGDFNDFLQWVGMYIGRRVISEVQRPPKGRVLSWHYNERRPATEEQRKMDHDEHLVLKHVTEQTGVTFSKEKRRVRVLFVERVD